MESVLVSLTTDATGNPVAQSRYLPYGQERWITGTLTTDFGFTGQRADNYTHLIEMGARWYDPQLNRWISADTIVPQASNPQSLNRYTYAYNNPAKYNDPNGHEPPADYPLLDQAIKYFEALGWIVVGDPSTKSLTTNGADVVFTQGENVVAVELKAPTTRNVTLGTLGKSVGETPDYGGSISRVLRGADQFAESPVDQLRLESEVISKAKDAGKLENALFTSAKGVSKGAQNQFNGVYVRNPDGTVSAVKSMPSSGAIGRLKEDLFNYYIGGRMFLEGVKSIPTVLENTPLLPPILIVPNPNFYLDPDRPLRLPGTLELHEATPV